MNNPELQKELLEKIKPGTKPSDLKKESKKPTKKAVSPPPISIDKGYSSDKGKKVPKAPPLPNPEIKSLQTQIKSLQKQLQIYQDFKNADLKIKEKQKAQIENLTQELANTQKRLRESFEERSLMNKTIQDLKTKQNPPENTKDQSTQTEAKPKLYLFTCTICEQNKKSQLHLGKVNGLGINPTKTQKICDYCIKKVDLIQEPQEDFF